MNAKLSLLTVNQTADVLHLSVFNVRKLIREGKLASVLIGNKRLITEQALIDFIEQCPTGPRACGFGARR